MIDSYPRGEREDNVVPSFSIRLGFLPADGSGSDVMTMWTKDERDPAYDAAEERLQGVYDTILQTLQQNTNKSDFAGASQSLLGRARELRYGKERDEALLGAYVASMLDEDPRNRIDFLMDVMDGDVNKDLARLCAEVGDHMQVFSAIDRFVPVNELEDFFKIPPHVAGIFFDKMADVITEEKSPRSLQVKLFKAMPDEAIDDLREKAHRASISGDKVAPLVNDISKIERFALTQQFLADQAGVVLGEDLTHTPLEAALQSKATPKKQGDIEALSEDIAEAFKELSESVIEEYKTDRTVGEGFTGLSKQQQATLRFRQLRAQGFALLAAGTFIDSGLTRILRKDLPVLESGLAEKEVWGASEEGAAAPIIVAQTLRLLTNQARAQSKELSMKPEVLAKALFVLAQEKRREILAIATVGVEDLDERVRKGLSVVGQEEFTFVRDGSEKLGMRNSLKPGFKDAAEVRAAVILGCPALRVKHEGGRGLSQEEKMLHGSANYIDHVLAVAFNEAYRRGIFAVS